MRKEYIQHGEILPMIFPAGPNNPMGSYALYLGKHYSIHGTNNDFGIGLRITRGCIRLCSQDIEYLYTLAPVGTKVKFINTPVKIAIDCNGMRYLEIHRPLCSNNAKQTVTLSNLKTHVYSILKNISNVDYTIVDKVLQEHSGIPINITLLNKE